jgi:hypothetical protein
MSVLRSVQAEQRQDRHDHDDQADQINDAIHESLLTLIEILKKNARGPRKFASGLFRVRELDGEMLAAAGFAELAGAHQHRGADENHENRADQHAENAGRAAAAVCHGFLLRHDIV